MGTTAGTINLRQLVGDLARRDRSTRRSEADIQAGIQTLLLTAPLNLEAPDLDADGIGLETQAGAGRRIDIEVGSVIIEVKKDLRVANVEADAITQLAGYVRQREQTVATRYVGVLTDGARWTLYHLVDDNLEAVDTLEINPNNPDVDALILWLDGVLATTSKIHPSPDEIARRLGADATGHQLDAADLAALYSLHRDNPTVRLKRELWGRLLTTALGTAFDDSDELFVHHTLLVLSAECIAHALIGWDLDSDALGPAAICAGTEFTKAHIYNVVEADFFDWPIEVDGGERFLRTLAHRLGRFAWSEAEHDVMKVLYEAVIPSETRHSLGEYYTPDWLADRVVAATVNDPLNQRVMDPSCGSGTFLFHAVQHYLAAAATAGMDRKDALAGVCRSVFGIDVHPVAVSFARVTYLLALGNLDDRPALSIPVYLGDSVQWRQEDNLLTHDTLTIETDPANLFDQSLRFPQRLLDDPSNFDQLVAELAEKASKRRKIGTTPSIVSTLKRYGIEPGDETTMVTKTFATMCSLHDLGRDHIWGYFTRNVARPYWFARPANRVDVLVGNPPWLAYRFMPEQMKTDFRRMSVERGMWAGASVATHQDLSGLFVARTAEQYLRVGGRFGFVMPLAALSRKQFAGFRTGTFQAKNHTTHLDFDEPWDLDAVTPPIFPVPACVVSGRRAPDAGSELSRFGRRWSGNIPHHNASWPQAEDAVTVTDAVEGPVGGGERSAYAADFTQGANVVPRMLWVVEDASAGPLGAGPGRRAVQSWRSTKEKQPWKSLPAVAGAVEEQFVVPMHLGETIVPFRLLDPFQIVLPVVDGEILDPDGDKVDDHPGLAAWWRVTNDVWLANRSSDRMTLTDQINFRNKLTGQFGCDGPRVVYAKAGMHLAAAIIDDPAVIIDHMLYWAPVSTHDEGLYLCGVFNSTVFTDAVSHYQSRGQFGARHFDKYVFELPTPRYDHDLELHTAIVDAARDAEKAIAGLDLGTGGFQRQRRTVRDHLAANGIGDQLNTAVTELLELE